MYTLFYDDTKEIAGIYESKAQAVVLAKLLSTEQNRTILVIFNRQDGTTAHCGEFKDGEQTFDGGCCPPPWNMPQHLRPTG